MRPEVLEIYVAIVGYLSFCSGTRLIGSRTTWNATWSDRLKRDLLFRYDKFARPTQHYNTTHVDFGLAIYHVSLDESRSAITVQSRVRMAWTDDKLKWNASEYGGLRKLVVGNHEIWQPDIALFNSVSGSAIEHYGDVNCHIYANGKIDWTPPSRFNALCNIDLHLWPFDTQTCELKFGSWSFTGSQMNLTLLNDMVPAEKDIEVFPNAEWQILDMIKQRNVFSVYCCPEETHVTLNFILKIKRNSPLYSPIFIAPTALIVVMILVNFLLPPHKTEKIFLAGSTAIIISLYLLFFAYKIPPLSQKTPLIVSFYSGCLYQVTISLVISAVVINLSRRPHCQPLPRTLKKILVGSPGKYMGLSDLIHVIQCQQPSGEQELRESNADSSIFMSNFLSNNSDRETIISTMTDGARLEWILAATAIDRVSFLVFCHVFAVMIITCWF